MKQQILTMLELQNAMNQKVNDNWRKQGFAWHRAIWVESAELLEHYGWKWWKKQSPDRDQVILELIDIWHFGLSQLMQDETDTDGLAERIAHELKIPAGPADFKDAVEFFIARVLERKQFPIAQFSHLLKLSNLPFEQLFSLYIGKNTLNFFRQDNGYKQGTYNKIWQGREDNEHLMDILVQVDPAAENFQEQVYKKLSALYTQ